MQRKPVDVGNGVVTGSFATSGQWLAVTGLHSVLGLVELVAAPRFDPAVDGDGDAVRSHRRRLADPAYAVLEVRDTDGWWDSVEQRWLLRGFGWHGEAQAWAAPGAPTVRQRIEVRPDSAGSLRLRARGRMDRPSYAMITPVGATPGPLPPTSLSVDSGVLSLEVPGSPPVRATLSVWCDNVQQTVWIVDAGHAELEVSWSEDAGALTVEVAVSFARVSSAAQTVSAVRHHQEPAAQILDRVGDGARRYTLACTAVPVSEDACCLTTDHRLLPLSWTRDAYYQAALLLGYGDTESVAVVERHLAWLWTVGRDADGVWQRSHYVTGQVKDPVFQADQQLYPLLELADFRRATGRWPQPPAEGWQAGVRRVWASLPRDPNGLMAAAENPADDPAELPYQLSSQLLLAYTACRLAEWDTDLGMADLDLPGQVTELMSRIETAFTCHGPFGAQWAYESDAQGRVRLYHDANDVPTACAALWGLCGVDHLVWRNTMRFAWSENNPGYVTGRHGGLGSAHTPGVWPLGDAQEWVVATLTGDPETAARLEDKVALVASNDGLLPETYDPETGDWWARDWFAWPGSLVGLVNLTLRHGRGPWAR